MIITGNQEPAALDINTERPLIENLIQEFKKEQEKTETRKKLRQNKRNVEQERANKNILSDETIIPDRTINLNISRERVAYLSYLRQAKRTLILTDLQDPATDTQPTELWFTRGMRYPSWFVPWTRLIDSSLLHGGCALEVRYDPTKPLCCRIEYIDRKHLIIPEHTKDIQSCVRILRQYDCTLIDLERYTKEYGFNPAAVEEIKKCYTQKEETATIYKQFSKKDGIVYISWYCPKYNQTWLKDPAIYEIGLFQFEDAAVMQAMQSPTWEIDRQQFMVSLPLREYTIYWFPHEYTEEEELLQVQGRASLDLHVQEALTTLLTNTVNGSTRASNFYPSAENEPGGDSGMMELGPMKHGHIMSRKISVFQPNWPSNIILSVMQVLDQRKANDSGNTDYAAINRKDANKTAREMDLSVQQSQELSGTNLSFFSIAYLQVYTLCFLIAKHQAMFDLCQGPPNKEMLFLNYHIESAGDVEVLKREEEKQSAKEFFSLVQGTPAAEKLVGFLMHHYFPDRASEWEKYLTEPSKDQMISTLISILEQIPLDELPPEQQQQLGSIVASAKGMVEQ